MDRADLRLIRPKMYVSKNTTAQVALKMGLSVVQNPCPANGNSKRQHIKELLASQAQQDPLIPKRLLAAVKNLWAQQF